jgi:PAS domain S-box-containing protein
MDNGQHHLRQSPLKSLTLKVSFFATAIMVVVVAVFSTVFIASEWQKVEQNILQNGKTFATFSAKSIYDNYVQFYTHPQPEDFENFKSRVQATLGFDEDIKGVSLMGLRGRILFDSSEFATGKYSGPARTVTDQQTLDALQKENITTRPIVVDQKNYTEIVVPLKDPGNSHILSMRYLLSYELLAQHMQDVYQRTIVVGLLLTAFAVVVATILARQLTRPIIRLTRVAQAIQGGNFDTRAEVRSKDEIGQLSLALNDMAKDLKNSYEGLEQKVDERTQALKKAESKLLENVHKQDALLASIGDGVIATDQDGDIVLMNKVAEEVYQIDSASMIGRPYTDIWHLEQNNEPIAKEQDPIAVALKTGVSTRTSNFSLAQQSKDGQVVARVPVSVSVSPAALEGRIIGAIVVWRDITYEKEVDRMKTEFISLASHQLRTPLSAIKWFSEMLMAGDAGSLKPEQQEFTRNIVESTQRMIDLVGALLNVSRLESGRLIVDPKPTKVEQLMINITNDINAKAAEKKQTVTVDVDPNVPEVNLDQNLISQVYINLLTNAIKYTPPEGKIHITVARRGDELVSSVSDNGLGIPKKDQPKIFQKFFRAENVVKVITDGTGLGLYLVKSIIESSGGRVWFESEENKGTTFWFSLPISGMKKHAGEVELSQHTQG